MKKILLFLAIIISLNVSCQPSTNTGIIPTPQFVDFSIFSHDDVFILDHSCVIIDDNKNEEISKIINTFKNDIQEITGLDLVISRKNNTRKHNIAIIKEN